jgi:hypothetical protein
VDTLQKTNDGKVTLWHPELTIRKVDQPLSKSMRHPLLSGKNKFSSFVEMASLQSDKPDLTFMSSTGNIVNPDADGLKMACNCRFVKDPTSPAFIQTGASMETQNKQTPQKNPELLDNMNRFKPKGVQDESTQMGTKSNVKYLSLEDQKQKKNFVYEKPATPQYEAPAQNDVSSGSPLKKTTTTDDEMLRFYEFYKKMKAMEESQSDPQVIMLQEPAPVVEKNYLRPAPYNSGYSREGLLEPGFLDPRRAPVAASRTDILLDERAQIEAELYERERSEKIGLQLERERQLRERQDRDRLYDSRYRY